MKHLTAALLAGAVAGAALVVAPQQAGADAPRTVRHTGARPGALLEQEALPASFRTPATGGAVRVRYGSTGEDGSPATVSGMVYLPKGRAPHGGWPVVAWDHGTVGVADACAPSVTGPDARAHTLFESWLKRGYAVVATDYEGLGTDGEHTYVSGRSEAHATADIVRAARRLDPRVGRKWAVYGHSQGGGAALFTAAYAHRYAPELDFRGAAAAAPPSHWAQILGLAGAGDPQATANPYIALLVSGMAAAEPDVKPADYLTPQGMKVLEVARDGGCLAEVFKAGEGLKNADFVYGTPRNGAPGLAALLAHHSEPPVTRYREPVLIVQGTADTTVPAVTSKEMAAALARAGTRVTYTSYEGVDHPSLPVTALDDVDAWLDARLAR
ncbi:alpha/beta fold hydrolase [Streptomyces sp. NPDC058287]|uniref:alpha/beta fold hydrolase n=1 Tax=unclassified Streptomyces TaxID=2593676 RepID=UPI0036EC8D9D